MLRPFVTMAYEPKRVGPVREKVEWSEKRVETGLVVGSSRMAAPDVSRLTGSSTASG